MAMAYGAAGWAGLGLFFALCIAASLLIVGRGLLRSLPPRYAVAALALLCVVLAPFTLARPHLIGWPLLAGWLTVLLRARDQNGAPRLHWSLLMLVWANLHASYIFGLALVGLFAIEALIVDPDRKRVIVGWGGFGLATLLMACITPHGPAGLLFPFQVSQMTVLPLIQEWRPTRLPGDATFMLFTCSVLAAMLLCRRGLTVMRLLLIAGLAWLAFAHARHQALFAILSVLVLTFARPPEDRPDQARRFDPASLSLLAIGLMVVAVVRLALPFQRTDSPTDPATAISRVPESLRKQPVLNTYSFGGPLIRNGIAPFIDGRADMYGDAFIIQHQRIVEGDSAAFAQAQRRWGFKWTILAPRTRLVTLLDRNPDWRRFYSDQWAVVHVYEPHSLRPLVEEPIRQR